MDSSRLLLFSVLLAAALGILLGSTPNDLDASTLPQLPLYSDGPIHWHAHLSIIDGDEEVIVPADVGLSSESGESPIHTHDESGILHVEAQSIHDLPQHTLAHFFSLWGQALNTSCAADVCTTAYRQLDFYVNGVQRLDWLTYDISEGDDIEFVLEDDIETLRT